MAAYEKKYANKQSDRIDTTITLVAVHGGDTSSSSAARRYVRDRFPEANVLGQWLSGERDSGGNLVYAVEWEDESE